MTYLKTAEVAKIERVNTDTIRRRCNAKAYPGAYKRGRDWLIPARHFKEALPEPEPSPRRSPRRNAADDPYNLRKELRNEAS